MTQWLKGGFEMDRQGRWRLKPQVADTLERDITAMMTQTGWQRSVARNAEDQTSMGTDINAGISTGTSKGKRGSSAIGSVSAGVGFGSTDRGLTSEAATARIDIVNYDVRNAIAAAERNSATSQTPETTFASEIAHQILGDRGLRNRYLEQADSARGTADVTGPIISVEQSSILSKGRFFDDLAHGPFDGDPAFKERRDK